MNSACQPSLGCSACAVFYEPMTKAPSGGFNNEPRDVIEVINFEDPFYLPQQANQQAEVPAMDANYRSDSFLATDAILESLMPSGAETTNRRHQPRAAPRRTLPS
jgi:hypothetical protein